MLCFTGLILITNQSFGEKLDSTSMVPDSLTTVIENDLLREDDLFEQFQSESDHLQPLDDMTWRREHPYNLNTITEEELESLPTVSPFEVTAFTAFRTAAGKITAIEQIKAIEGIGEELFEKVSPYVTVNTRTSLVRFRSRTTRDLQPRRGDLDGTFAGSSLKSYNRILLEGRDIQAGALFEKDGGERFSNGFVSGYASVKNLGFLSQVVAGDFNMEAGQGLVLWRGTSFGKGSVAVSVMRKSALGAQPYRASDEFNFFRGVAASSSIALESGRIEATAFLSRRLLDATVDTSDEVSGFYKEGLFRTQNELTKQKAVAEQVVGGRLQFVGIEGWNVGSTVSRSTFDKTIFSDRTYEFTGHEQDVIGLDAAATIGRLSAFAEIARSGDRALAGIVGTMLNVGSKSSIALTYRDYGPAFNSFHANGFGERSDTKNERGFYFGVDVWAFRWLRLSGYVDQFTFPWRTYSAPLPTSGHEILLQTDATFSRKLDLTVRFTRKSTDGTEADVDIYGRETRPIVNRAQQKYRLAANYKATPRVYLKGRLEFTEVRYTPLNMREHGYLLYQDVRVSLPKKLVIEGRLVFFQTDSYDSRLYEYENDLRGVFSNPALYGKGRRWYVVARYDVSTMVTLSLKYSETQKEGVTSLGSGSTEVIGDLDNRITLQLDVTL